MPLTRSSSNEPENDGSESLSDAFTYSAKDGELDSEPVEVLLTVSPVNDAPVALGDDYELEEGVTLFRHPLDDLGLRPLEADEPIDLYEIIRQRYEHGSMIITSNRALEEWYPLFVDDLMASAAMDRLLHHGHQA